MLNFRNSKSIQKIYFELERQILVYNCDHSLPGVWGNRHCHILLIDVQINVRLLKNNLAVSIVN